MRQLIQPPGLRLIHPRAVDPAAAAVDPTAAGTPAVDSYTGLGFWRRGESGASGNRSHDRRAQPLPKARQKQTTIERFAALIAESLFIG
jgi:hypothetical protein